MPAPTEIYQSNASILFFGVEKLFLGAQFSGLGNFFLPGTIARLIWMVSTRTLDIGQRVEPSRCTVVWYLPNYSISLFFPPTHSLKILAVIFCIYFCSLVVHLCSVLLLCGPGLVQSPTVVTSVSFFGLTSSLDYWGLSLCLIPGRTGWGLSWGCWYLLQGEIIPPSTGQVPPFTIGLYFIMVMIII